VPAELASHDGLAWGGLPASHGWRYRVDGRAVEVPVREVFRANQAAALVRMAAAGIGVVRLPGYVLDEALRRGELVPLLGGFEPQDDAALHLVWLPNRYPQPKVRAFVDFVLARFGSADAAPAAAQRTGGTAWAKGRVRAKESRASSRSDSAASDGAPARQSASGRRRSQ
jgi:DNA-binding transcriptional LysR family regulator